MFEHVTVLLSFVYAIALTHLLSSANELVLERGRVRFSWLYALWWLNALLALLVNWVSMFGLVALKQWTVGEVVVQFSAALIQYFTCSTLSIRPHDNGPIDLPAFFTRQWPVIGGSFVGLALIAMVVNWWDRNSMAGLEPGDLIVENMLVLVAALPIVAALRLRRVWAEAFAGLVTLALAITLLVNFAVTG